LRLKRNICAYNTANKERLDLRLAATLAAIVIILREILGALCKNACLMNISDEVELKAILATIAISYMRYFP